MRRYLPVLFLFLSVLTSCVRKTEQPKTVNEDMYGIDYYLDGQYHEIFMSSKETEFSPEMVPTFTYVKGDTKPAVIQFNFDYGGYRLRLTGDRPYFFNKHVYKIDGNAEIVLDGLALVEGEYSIHRGQAHPRSNWQSSYSSFFICFSGRAANGSEISNGRLWYMEKIAGKFSANDFKFYIYDP